jgi:hypothetical protein
MFLFPRDGFMWMWAKQTTYVIMLESVDPLWNYCMRSCAEYILLCYFIHGYDIQYKTHFYIMTII